MGQNEVSGSELFKYVCLSFYSKPSLTATCLALTSTTLDAEWQKWPKWSQIHGWPKGLKVRGDSEDDGYE